MRRTSSAIVAALVSLTVLIVMAGSATAHGSCDIDVSNPYASGGLQIAGSYDCYPTHHTTTTIKLAAQRRTPGQAFSQFYSITVPYSNTTQAAYNTSTTYNCAKDYRVIATGTATGGHQASKTSSIYFHTC